jgi:hypothetical protein
MERITACHFYFPLTRKVRFVQAFENKQVRAVASFTIFYLCRHVPTCNHIFKVLTVIMLISGVCYSVISIFG